jgi:hypothetical protein
MQKRNEVTICNINRTHDLDKRIEKRFYPEKSLQMEFSVRPTRTRQVLFPILDCHRASLNDVQNNGIHNTQTSFSPGDSAPFNGYMSNIDVESRLKNIVFPLQRGVQSKFIPGTESDLFDNSGLIGGRVEEDMYTLLNVNENYETEMPKHLDKIGNNVFYNHTLYQTKNV